MSISLYTSLRPLHNGAVHNGAVAQLSRMWGHVCKADLPQPSTQPQSRHNPKGNEAITEIKCTSEDAALAVRIQQGNFGR